MDDESSLYMCLPCYQLFNSMEEILAHQQTCHTEDATGHANAAGPTGEHEEQVQSVETLLYSCPAPQEISTAPKQAMSQTTQTQTSKSSVPLIRYQCGSCEALFESLTIWQQHRKSGCSSSEEGNQVQTAETKCASQQEEKNVISEDHSYLHHLPEPAAPAVNGLSPLPRQNFLCVHCGSGFGTEAAMVAHRKGKHGLEEAVHRCSLCGESFMSTTLFLYHRRQHREKEAGRANELVTPPSPEGTDLSGSVRVKAAEKDVTPNTDVDMEGSPQAQCDPLAQILEPTQKSGDLGPQLQLSHNAKTLYTCKSCNKVFFNKSNLARHVETHSAVPNRDTVVETKADERGTEQSESRQLSNEPAFACTLCNQTFLGRKRLQQHAVLHEGALLCPCCSSPFLSLSALQTHTQTCSPGRRRGRRAGLLICDTCGHRCMTQDGLDLHQLSHMGQTPLRCPLPLCRRRFISDAALEEHVLSHSHGDADALSPASKPRPFSCDHCGKDFTSASSLRVHLRIHTGERPYQCTQCGQRFRQIPHLRDHERVHSGTRPFTCTVCGKSFVLAARLVEHARIHSGDKPYVCPLCPRAFRSLSNLGKHRKTHGKEHPAGQETTHTILLLQTPPSVDQPSLTSSTTSPVVLLQPTTTGSKEEEDLTAVPHAVEIVVEVSG